jgi:DNA-binding NtrC family response regulator
MGIPGVSGAAFLSEARLIAPDTTRVLLTGYADVETAISAVNTGQVFRFLTKPCQIEELLATGQAAVEQNRLRTAEKQLLDETLKGSARRSRMSRERASRPCSRAASPRPSGQAVP